MATITPAVSFPADDTIKILWEGIATGDTIQPIMITENFGGIASVQIAGTFGGATVSLGASNDETNYVTMHDIFGASISKAAADLVDFSTAALMLKPAISGGTGDDVDVTVVLRK